MACMTGAIYHVSKPRSSRRGPPSSVAAPAPRRPCYLGPMQAPASEPVTAVVAVSGDPGHLNPAISTAGPLHAIAGSLFNGLVALDRDVVIKECFPSSVCRRSKVMVAILVFGSFS